MKAVTVLRSRLLRKSRRKSKFAWTQMTIKTQPPKVSVNAVVRENFTQKQAYLREQEKQQMNSFLFSRLVVSDSS